MQMEGLFFECVIDFLGHFWVFWLILGTAVRLVLIKGVIRVLRGVIQVIQHSCGRNRFFVELLNIGG